MNIERLNGSFRFQLAVSLMRQLGYTEFMMRTIVPSKLEPDATSARKPVLVVRHADFTDEEWNELYHDTFPIEGKGLFLMDRVTMGDDVVWPNRRLYRNVGDVRTLSVILTPVAAAKAMFKHEAMTVKESDIRGWLYVVNSWYPGA